MAILNRHVRHHEDILGLPGILQSPALVFGYQEIRMAPVHFADFRARTPQAWFKRAIARLGGANCAVATDYRSPGLDSLLRARGVDAVTTLDLFDQRADLQLDMNSPVANGQLDRYLTVIDIGSLEHVFDTRQCLDNLIGMLQVGGHLILQTPVNGYFGHGLHVFNPLGLVGALESNGCDIVFKRYTTAEGRPVSDPSKGRDVMIWIVAHKRVQVAPFRSPQQDFWETYYAHQDQRGRQEVQRRYWAGVR